MDIEIVDVFTYDGKGGNKAGVIISPDIGINCQKIASDLGFSETVFVEKVDKNIFKLEFYTPKCRIEFCGHASLGAFYILKKNEVISTGEYIARTDIGDIHIFVERKKIFLAQDEIEIAKVIDEKEVIKSLNIDMEDLENKLPIRIVYSGLRDILVPIKNKNILNEIKINKEMVENISKDNFVVGYHLFYKNGDKIYARNFAPLYGIDEEAATGSSNGALLGYLYKIGEIDPGEYEITQGENYEYPSKIIGKILENGKIYIGSEF
nr:PhzF family phenazine biosynthesis protein [uncultured Cetobacterium sp.]